ncbi:hypothetical protein [Aurantiacibacter sediminis]|uniref:Uncharacterized protein n=1 Tax=Aurantiacibacter sediminis TaxID=2793064 RepID=A0ABS0N0Z0_9SPHN|nr:hypothetical protein [Aurantiacibacter sediminis]MBH5321619.1 hypothetical protein [Aurantiacibacter sediminis]
MMSPRISLLLSASALLAACATTLNAPTLPMVDTHAARTMVAVHGEALWPGWAEDDRAVLLVAKEAEYLLCAPQQQGFVAVGTEPVTGCSRQTRPVQTPADIAAPSEIGDVLVASIGLPDALGADGIDWQLTLAHELFHSWQDRMPGYNAAVMEVTSRLAPADAGDAGWMLTYPFPYAEAATAEAFAPMAAAAHTYLAATDQAARRAAIVDYLAARHAAEAQIGHEDWLYYEFQAGQEGVARWTELALAQRMAQDDPRYVDAFTERRGGLATSLRAIDRQGIGMWRRNVFYVYGAIEADMLDTLDPVWRLDYPARPFALGEHLQQRLD